MSQPSPTPKSADTGVEPSAVWRVCHVITADCKRCSPTERHYGDLCVRACYMQAEECINTVETGNPWRKTGDVKPPWIVLPDNDWRPIESAPKDGTTVLLWAPHWSAAQTGWTFGADAWQDCPKDSHLRPPTHWMPLPEPPK